MNVHIFQGFIMCFDVILAVSVNINYVSTVVQQCSESTFMDFMEAYHCVVV